VGVFYKKKGIFINMKPYEKFLNESIGLKELIEIYLQLRQHFQELGFSESDLVSPPTYTPLMMSLHQKFQASQKALFQQVKDYGLDISRNEFSEYIAPILSKIDQITPLSHGNYERGN
jgi:hypothetical protein